MANAGLHIAFAPKLGDIGAEIMRHIRLSRPRDIVLRALDREKRRARDRRGLDLLALPDQAAARKVESLKDAHDRLKKKFGREVRHGEKKVQEWAAGRIFAIVVHQFTEKLTASKEVTRQVGEQPRFLNARRINEPSHPGVGWRDSSHAVLLEPRDGLALRQEVAAGWADARIDFAAQ